MTYGRLLDLRIFFDRQEVMQCPCQHRKKVINHWWLAISDCPGKEVFREFTPLLGLRRPDLGTDSQIEIRR